MLEIEDCTNYSNYNTNIKLHLDSKQCIKTLSCFFSFYFKVPLKVNFLFFFRTFENISQWFCP